MTGSPTREALADAIARGATDAEAGRRFGLSRSAVRRLRRRWGIATCRNSCRPPDPPRSERAFRWGRGNLGEREIARLYGGRRYDETGGGR
ncbi:MAG: helix-turn-helix domain-containing protein [Rhodospirillales bacterium]|nr:helix-turn-helix domain-containing protein [Rhodospirillales bacterium]MDH3910303.1 helix-turn-helix domain-containing protein [Rhodospirillales bacterium]MDH3918114.1 helix-turn-helix domain-containing protein [Rhodospirillales bacterium]MDH3968979.1 helix-turn-helix domain-containing protein [Rhodospirillales bacterium]